MIVLPLIVLVVMLPVMAMAWVTQRRTGNAGWIDVFWTFGTGLGATVCALAPLHGAAPDARQWLVGLLVLLWSLRLGTYIALRVARSPREDVRYTQFRKDWGADYQRRMFRFIIVQAPIAAILALSVMTAARADAGPLTAWDLAGAAIMAIAIAGETLADAQMRRARRRNGEGGLCRDGLWNWSRHPNYVFEWLVWLAFPVIAFGAGHPGTSVWPWLSLLAPIQMYWLLVHVSGIPPLEEAMLRSRPEAYRAYQAAVPPFLPNPFRKVAR